MRKFYLLGFLFLSLSRAQAQSVLSVSSGTDFFISSGTDLSLNGLVLTPSSDFTINGSDLQKNAAITAPSNNISIGRSYRFINTIPVFSGNILLRYDDAELNGLVESDLRLNIYGGSNWQSFNISTNDVIGNSVLISSLSGLALGEMTLADLAHALPVKWGTVAAYRAGSDVKLEWNTQQEINCKHFDVQKMADGRNWTTIITGIPATNTNFAHRYTQSDINAGQQRLSYRIKQTDIDGTVGYSIVVAVAAESNNDKIILYPNPVHENFYISGANTAGIKRVQLYAVDGTLVKTWNSFQTTYRLNGLPAGSYKVVISRGNLLPQYITISKQ
jgi:hypothetical protein